MNHKSIYLVDAQIKESALGIMIILGVGTFFLVRRIMLNRKTKGSGDTPQNIWGTVVFYCMGIAVFLIDTRHLISAKVNYEETIGVTTGKDDKGRVKYEYIVDGKKYEMVGERSYPINNYFDDIEENGARYIVIFDSTNPAFSLIDFKRRVRN